jgi:hypothetical protein
MISRFARALALTTLSISTFSHASGDELLVLRNGYVISGQVSRVGDRYIVRVAEGSETRIPTSSVEFRCRDLEDAYRQKASRIKRGRISERIELIEWCLRHELVPRAQEQLVISEQLDPLNPRLHHLRRRLDSVFKINVVPESVPVSVHRLNAEDLDLMMRGLPRETVEQFTNTVQPLLVNRCSTGGCHGPSTETAFRLIRPRPGRELERPFTQRNLHATLRTIDRDYPLSSSLLKVLSEPHGPNGSVKVTLSKDQADQVVKWIKTLSKGKLAKRPSTISTSAPTLLQATPASSHRTGTTGKDDSSRLRDPRTTDGIAPTDPFDPGVFNRRYHSKPENRSVAPKTRSVQAPPAFKSPIPRR